MHTSEVPNLSTVSSKSELSRFLDDVNFLKSASEARLSKLLSSNSPAKAVSDINDQLSKLEASSTLASKLTSILNEASNTSKESKQRIEQIILLHSRAVKSRELVEYVTELRQSIQGIQGAMEMKEWVRAAEIANVALKIPDSVYESNFALRTVPTIELPDPPRKTVNDACDELSAIFIREFDKAANAKDMASLTHYFKLFPLIDRKSLGLQRYAYFICQIIAGMSRNLLQGDKQTHQAPNFYAIAFSKLMENVAVIISQHSNIVSRHYGKDAMSEIVIPLIQNEVDKQAGLIIDTFWDERRIEQLINNCKAYSYPQLVKSFFATPPTDEPNSKLEEESLVDLTEASSRLSEISTMMNRWYLYSKFVNRKHSAIQNDNSNSDDKNTDSENGTQTAKSSVSKLNLALSSSMTQSKMTAVMGPTYSVLSLFVFRRSVERAFTMDDLPSKDIIESHQVFSVEAPLVSSLVDDILYAFSNILGQTVDCEDPDTVNSSVAALKRVLESDLVGTLQRKLRQSAPTDSLNTGDFGGCAPFMIYLNDLQVSSAYVSKVVDNILTENHSDLVFDLNKLLNSFKLSFQQRTEELVKDGCQTLNAIKFGVQVRSIFQKVFKVPTYTGDSDYSRNGYAYELQFKRLMKPLLQILHPVILNELLTLICKQVALQIEKFIWSLESKMSTKQVIMLEKDINAVISVSSESNYSLRKSFDKVSQMLTVLIESDESNASKLTKSEISKLQKFVQK